MQVSAACVRAGGRAQDDHIGILVQKGVGETGKSLRFPNARTDKVWRERYGMRHVVPRHARCIQIVI